MNEYSKANWGDHIETQEGRTIHVNSASSLVTIVLKLKDKQWEKIFVVALASMRRRTVRAQTLAAATMNLDFSQAASIELQDDNSDLSDAWNMVVYCMYTPFQSFI